MGLSIGPKIGVEGADQFRAEFKEMVAITSELQSKMDALSGSFSKYDSTLVKNKQTTQMLTDQIRNQETVVTSAKEGYDMANKALEDNKKHLEDTKNVLELVRPSIEGMQQRVDEAKAAVEAQSEVVQEASQRVTEARARVNELSAEYSAHNRELQEAKTAQKEVTDAQVQATNEALKAYRDAEKEYAKNAQAQETSRQTIEQTTPQIELQRAKVAELQATLEELNRKQGLFKAGQEAAAEQTRKNTAELGTNATATRASRELRNEYTASAKANAAEIKTTSDALKDETKVLDSLIKSHDKAVATLADSESKEEKLAEAVMRTGDAFFEESQKLDTEQKALDDINTAISENQRLYGKYGEVTQELRKERDNLIETENKEKQTLKELQGEQEKQEGLLKDTKQEVKDLEKELSSTEKAINVGRETVAKWADVMYTAQAKIEEFKKKLRETPGALETFLGSVQDFGNGVASVGETLTKYITAPLTALGTYSVKTASDFTDALAKISTIADTTKVPLETFRTEIQRISDETGRSVDDVSAATYQALSAAVDTKDAIEFVEGAANLARAGFLDMYGSVDILTTILNSYKKSVDEVEHISDVLVKTQDMGKPYLFVFNAKNRYMPFTLVTA